MEKNTAIDNKYIGGVHELNPAVWNPPASDGVRMRCNLREVALFWGASGSCLRGAPLEDYKTTGKELYDSLELSFKGKE